MLCGRLRSAARPLIPGNRRPRRASCEMRLRVPIGSRGSRRPYKGAQGSAPLETVRRCTPCARSHSGAHSCADTLPTPLRRDENHQHPVIRRPACQSNQVFIHPDDFMRAWHVLQNTQEQRAVLRILLQHVLNCRKIRFREAFKTQIHCTTPLLQITKNPDAVTSGFAGGEDATRTHNALRHTTFPMWLLTIRIPLHGDFDIIPYAAGKIKGYFQFFSFFFLGVHLSSRNRCQES